MSSRLYSFTCQSFQKFCCSLLTSRQYLKCETQAAHAQKFLKGIEFNPTSQKILAQQPFYESCYGSVILHLLCTFNSLSSNESFVMTTKYVTVHRVAKEIEQATLQFLHYTFTNFVGLEMQSNLGFIPYLRKLVDVATCGSVGSKMFTLIM